MNSDQHHTYFEIQRQETIAFFKSTNKWRVTTTQARLEKDILHQGLNAISSKVSPGFAIRFLGAMI